MLPLELFQDILRHLPIADYMATKFVCRSFRAATFSADGRDIVHVRAKLRRAVPFWWERYYRLAPPALRAARAARFEKTQLRQDYSAIMIRIEMNHPTKLCMLTCSDCGARKPHGVNGFPDEQFDQNLCRRYCLECRVPPNFQSWNHVLWWLGRCPRVDGVCIKWCASCAKFHKAPRPETRNLPAVPEHHCDEVMEVADF